MNYDTENQKLDNNLKRGNPGDDKRPSRGKPPDGPPEFNWTKKFKNEFTKRVGNQDVTATRFNSMIPFSDDPDLLDVLEENGVLIEAKASSNWGNLLTYSLPWLFLIFFWVFMLRQIQGGPKGIFSFGKSKARLLTGSRPKVTFADVAGCDEAKQELQEIIEFLRDPGKFQKLGGKIPKCSLLLGPPRTGQTLFALALARR